jgi:hypothetical protein
VRSRLTERMSRRGAMRAMGGVIDFGVLVILAALLV